MLLPGYSNAQAGAGFLKAWPLESTWRTESIVTASQAERQSLLCFVKHLATDPQKKRRHRKSLETGFTRTNGCDALRANYASNFQQLLPVGSRE
jgi:hypothetical protein